MPSFYTKSLKNDVIGCRSEVNMESQNGTRIGFVVRMGMFYVLRGDACFVATVESVSYL